MRVVAFNGSPRPEGNTSTLIRIVFQELEAESIETEMINICGKPMRGCMACGACGRTKDMRCIQDDGLNEWITKMVEADGIILASPTYFSNVSAEMKVLIDRAGLVAIANDAPFKYKVGAPIVAVRRAGALSVYNGLMAFFGINQMIVPGSCYWNLGIGRVPGDVEHDEEGLLTMRTLGRNMAWLLKKLKS